MTKDVPVRLLGTSFTIRTDQNPDRLEALIQQLGIRLEELKTRVQIQDPLKLALLACLSLLDDLETGVAIPKLMPDEELSQLTDSLIRRIDSVL